MSQEASGCGYDVDDDDDGVEGEALKPRAIGGGFEGYTLLGEVWVRVILLEDPQLICCGLITGAEDQFCLKGLEECTVKHHAKIKAILDPDSFYILCSKPGWAYYVSPNLERGAVNNFLSSMLDMELNIMEWQCFFVSAVQHTISSLEDFEERRASLMDGSAKI